MIGYKLFRKRKDGTYGPLFINRSQKLTAGLWYGAANIPTKGYAVRPGWHICGKKSAPHLKMKPDRVWCRVQYFDAVSIKRPESQGGLWWLANRMRILHEL
jgi:hypothetical protein